LLDPLPGIPVVLAALFAVACAVEEPPPRLGEPLADLRGATLDGDTLSIHGFRGSPVLVNLWATWCLPCRTETPFLQSVYERHRDQGLRVVGVSVDAGAARAQVEEFIQEAGVEYDILLDPEGRSLDLYSALGLPATYILDPEGIIRFLRLGPVQEEDPQFWSGLHEALR
jgi:peroxiredoxin